MKLVLGAVLCLALCTVPINSVNNRLKEVFAWKFVDYAWGKPEDRDAAIASGEFVPENNLPLGLEVWKDKLFITIPRWKNGVVSTLNYVKITDDDDTTTPLPPDPTDDPETPEPDETDTPEPTEASTTPTTLPPPTDPTTPTPPPPPTDPTTPPPPPPTGPTTPPPPPPPTDPTTPPPSTTEDSTTPTDEDEDPTPQPTASILPMPARRLDGGGIVERYRRARGEDELQANIFFDKSSKKSSKRKNRNHKHKEDEEDEDDAKEKKKKKQKSEKEGKSKMREQEKDKKKEKEEKDKKEEDKKKEKDEKDKKKEKDKNKKDKDSEKKEKKKKKKCKPKPKPTTSAPPPTPETTPPATETTDATTGTETTTPPPPPPPPRSPALIPYPSFAANKVVLDQDKKEDEPAPIVSVFRVWADNCDRLWVMDTGVADILGKTAVVSKPRILIYNLNNDELIKTFEFKDSDSEEHSFFANIIVDCDPNNCDKAFAYVPDLGGYGIVSYDFENDKTRRIKHNFFHFDPLAGNMDVGGVNFQWTDGVFSVALTKPGNDGFRNAYFHCLASTKEFLVSTKVLKSEDDSSNSYYDYKLVGDRGEKSQSSASYIHEDTGIMFYTQLQKDSVNCWNTNKPFKPENLVEVASDNETMIFTNDLKVDRDGNLWVLTDKLPVFIYKGLDDTEVNYRIFTATVDEAVSGTNCAP